jgi:disulfide bond formation protein DsbB
MSVPEPQPTPQVSQEPSIWLWGAMFASLVALAGMGLKACPLCLYQRTFVMGVVGVLAVGFFVKELQPKALSLLALPLAVGALAVVGWHEYLEQSGGLECPHGVLGVGTAPQQSLAILALLVALLVIDQLRQQRLMGVLATIVLGGLLAFSAIKSAVPPIPNYDLAVDEDMCRKPKN